ncbi:MAG TPA: alpha/beta fold hydrolase [Gemmatimonadaceae bacterium]|nr:alpha/beta fold hydrolase [Gemmatimonadaceae bacterium]
MHLARPRAAGRIGRRRAEGDVVRDPPQPARPIAGLIPGAEPIELRGAGDSAVLLIHGFGDTPQTFAYVAAGLHAAGFSVKATLLPGHGRSVDEFVRSRAVEWVAYARAEYEAMTASYKAVGLCGLSMGGAIATIIAAGAPRLPALALLAPYVGMPPVLATAAVLHRLWGPLAGQFKASSDLSIRDPEERAKNLAYGVTTGGAIRQLFELTRLARKAIPFVQAPTLIMQSRLDNRVSRRVAEHAYRSIAAREKRLIFVERGGHILTVDHDRQQVVEHVRDWFVTHMPK